MGEEKVDGYEMTVEKAIMLPEEEWLRARLVDVNRRVGKYGPLFNFTFKLLGEDYEDVALTGQMGAKVNSNVNTKSYKWYSGLVGHDLEEAEVVKVKEHVGGVYEIFIENKKGENKTFQNVTRIRKAEGETTKKAKTTKKTETPKEEDVNISEEDIPF